MLKGNVFIITAASGAGKTSLVSSLLKRDNKVKLSISHTTRPARPGELDGQHYHFVDDAAFDEILLAGGFLESADVHSAKYGTSQAAVDAVIDAGDDIVLEIDWQGAEQVRNLYKNVISIFILPPSMEALEERLNNRGQDSQEVIAKRVAAAKQEMSHLAEFDYVTINDDFEVALQDLIAIVRSHRLKRDDQVSRYHSLIQKLT